MKTKALVFAAIAACLSSSAFAQSYEYRDRYERQYDGDRYERQYDGDRYERRYNNDRYERSDYERRDGYRHGRRHRVEGAGPDRDLFVGSRLPQAYWDGSHRVRDWRRARLSAPLQGHNWHRIGNDFVLSSVSTGKISRIIVN